MQPEQTAEQTQLVDEAKTEAAELQADISEAKEEATEARASGDEARARKLEARVDALSTDLSEIKDTLKALAERPFAPAPQPKEEAATEDAPASETKEAEPETPRKKVHRFGSKTWFGERAFDYED